MNHLLPIEIEGVVMVSGLTCDSSDPVPITGNLHPIIDNNDKNINEITNLFYLQASFSPLCAGSPFCKPLHRQGLFVCARLKPPIIDRAGPVVAFVQHLLQITTKFTRCRASKTRYTFILLTLSHIL
jgi:hypothetical protein